MRTIHIKNKKQGWQGGFKKIAFFALMGTLLGLVSVWASAANEGVELSSIAHHVGSSIAALAKILNGVALVAGIGFVLASFFKFHQHKLNPTQVPISQGITLLMIGAGLMLFPVMLPTAKNALFGSSQKISHLSGGEISSLIGGPGS